MSERTCAVDGCDRTGRLKRQMCGMHYQRWARLGSSFDLPKKTASPCSGPGCERPGGDSGLCRSHYKQAHLGKPLTALRVPTRDLARPEVCSVDGCDRVHKARGYCKSHAEHVRKYGAPREVEPRTPGLPCKIDGCNATAIARKMCSPHLARVYTAQRYGITLADYEGLLASQGGGCAICGLKNANGLALSVDHDHDCCPGNRSCGGCVRGLLCGPCNFAIGHMKDSPQRLRAAAAYLETSSR